MMNKAKSVLTYIVLLLIFISGTGIAEAKTFSDVKSDSWYFEYVNQLADEGIIDTNVETYRPEEPATRAELVDMVITATKGLDGFVTPPNPTFSDVPADSKYYTDIEAAVKLGIVNGYTDADGNPTGKFGPDDTVSRAAATKILINAFKIPQETDSESIFPDVKKDSWYYAYVTTAHKKSIVSGYENGNFGPDDSVTRAQVAKLIVNAEKAVTPTETADSGLKVSLNANQPPAQTVPLGSTATFMYLDLTALNSDVHVSQITFTRGGVGSTSDWYGAYLYEGYDKITSEYSIDSSSNKVKIPVKLDIKAGDTRTFTVYADCNLEATPSNQHYFYIASASDITSDAKNITGDFPTKGSMVTIGNEYGNTITISTGPSISKPTRDEISEVATFKLTAGESGRVSFDGITLTQGGTLHHDKIKGCYLLYDSDIIAMTDNFIGDRISLYPETPYIIPSNKSRLFSVKCYIDGGKSTDTIQLYLDTVYDLSATDINFGFAAAPINYFDRATAPSTSLKPVGMTVH